MRGIYQIKNTTNGKVYIGRSANIEKRWDAHRRLLREGQHFNIHLQYAWNQYGPAAFRFEILENVHNITDIAKRECAWLEAAITNGAKVYNLILAINERWVYTEEVRQRISIAAYAQAEERSLAARQQWADPAQREKLLEGRRTSEELSVAALEWWDKHPDQRGRQAERLGVQWQDPEFRTRCIEGHRGATTKAYPAFRHKGTGEVISAGVNLLALCKERGLDNGCMTRVKYGKRNHHKGWELLGGT